MVLYTVGAALLTHCKGVVITRNSNKSLVHHQKLHIFYIKRGVSLSWTHPLEIANLEEFL